MYGISEVEFQFEMKATQRGFDTASSVTNDKEDV